MSAARPASSSTTSTGTRRYHCHHYHRHHYHRHHYHRHRRRRRSGSSISISHPRAAVSIAADPEEEVVVEAARR